MNNFLIFIIIVEDDGIDYRGSITRAVSLIDVAVYSLHYQVDDLWGNGVKRQITL